MAEKTKVSIDVSHLACPVCLDVPRAAILMCGNGHNICTDCHDCLPTPKTCPMCRLQYKDKMLRNYSLEQMLANLPNVEFKCRFTRLGCRFVADKTELVSHEGMCTFQPLIAYKCKFSKWGCAMSATQPSLHDHEEGCNFQPFECPLKQCNETLTMHTFRGHCSQIKHMRDIVDKGETPTYISFKYLYCTQNKFDYYTVTWKWEGTSFLAFCKYVKDVNVHYCWVAVAGTESMAKKYKCEIALDNDQIEPIYKFKGQVHSIDKRVDFIAETNQGLLLTKYVWNIYRQWDPSDRKPWLGFRITISQ